jgi:hypothetical protein
MPERRKSKHQLFSKETLYDTFSDPLLLGQDQKNLGEWTNLEDPKRESVKS